MDKEELLRRAEKSIIDADKAKAEELSRRAIAESVTPYPPGVAIMLVMAVCDNLYIWGMDRKDHIDSKSMQPGVTPGFPANKFATGNK